MSMFPILNDQDLSQSSETIFGEIGKKFGIVPVFYRFLANCPPLVEAYWTTYQKVIADGVLPINIKELIFLAVARKHQCVYCSSVHLAICDIFNIERHTLDNLMNDISNLQPERTSKLISFCLSSMDNPDEITEQDYQQLQSYGINQQEILEALYSVAYANSGVYLAKVTKIELDQVVIDYLADKKLTIRLV
ncbi:MAG: carboxymuconolactone decarboxylase family protein [Colwellia sp.]|nr:carboxymuconolactone decarboxylase family protein [Colwellia sp.]